jgi:hypothetical protein
VDKFTCRKPDCMELLCCQPTRLLSWAKKIRSVLPAHQVFVLGKNEISVANPPGYFPGSNEISVASPPSYYPEKNKINLPNPPGCRILGKRPVLPTHHVIILQKNKISVACPPGYYPGKNEISVANSILPTHQALILK